MAYTVTSSGRRLVMAALLALAIAGGVIRYFAPNPSTLHDVGTLLLVLWLPAVGNLISFLVRRIPLKAPRIVDFPAGAAFTPHLQVRLEPAGTAALAPAERRCTLLVGSHGFTARLAQPLLETLRVPGPQAAALELLHPAVALPHLAPGTDFHLLVGTTGVAKGCVTAT
jgi:hypothetical protein